VNGKEFASYGAKIGSGEGERTVFKKCVDWSRKTDGDLPQKVDLRPYMTEIENQADSNSCVANAVAGAYEYLCKRKAMENGDAGDDVGDISRLFIYYVGRKRDLFNGYSGNIKVKDEGMFVRGAIEALQMKGACLAETFPFDLEKVNEMPDREAFAEAMDYKISDAMKVPLDLDAMKSCLAEGYPIVFALKLTKQFYTPDERGYVRTPDPEDPMAAEHGRHGMLLVGYSDRQEVFIVRNSWGTEWGDEGYGYVPYDYIANADFTDANDGPYAIKALTEYDLTPDDDDGEDLPGYDEDEDGGETPDIEVVEEEDEEDEEDEDFDPDDMFSFEKEMKRAFDSCDPDGSGSIDKKELAVFLLRCGISPSDLDAGVKVFLDDYDKDESGTLSYEEFCAIWKEFGGCVG